MIYADLYLMIVSFCCGDNTNLFMIYSSKLWRLPTMVSLSTYMTFAFLTLKWKVSSISIVTQSFKFSCFKIISIAHSNLCLFSKTHWILTSHFSSKFWRYTIQCIQYNLLKNTTFYFRIHSQIIWIINKIMWAN